MDIPTNINRQNKKNAVRQFKSGRHKGALDSAEEERKKVGIRSRASMEFSHNMSS